MKVRYYARYMFQIALNNARRCMSLVYKIRNEGCWCVAKCGINFREFSVDCSSVVTTKQWLDLRERGFFCLADGSAILLPVCLKVLSKVASRKSFVWFVPDEIFASEHEVMST